LTASPEPTEDAELARLLDVHEQTIRASMNRKKSAVLVESSRAALLAHIAATYVRRDANRLPPSPPGSYREARGILPWRPGDELPEEAIRRLRDGQ
jgi:hypothetical protein